jgi:hypothetical protein
MMQIMKTIEATIVLLYLTRHWHKMNIPLDLSARTHSNEQQDIYIYLGLKSNFIDFT